MDNDRNIYLNAMRNQKRGLVYRDGVLVNPSINNDIGSLTALDTTFSKAPDEEQKENWWTKGVNTAITTAEEFSDNIQKGIYSFLDGIGDFFINSIGGIVSASGGDDSGFRAAANYDWSTQLINASNVFSYDATKDILTGNFKDIGDSFMDTFNKERSTERLLQNNQGSLTANFGEEGQKMYGNITQGIGSVLPSIVLGIFTGGAGFAAQAINLGALGVSAAGNTTTEAMNEGANYGQAFLSGAISAGIEVGTELASAGVGKVAGKVTGKAVTFGQNIAGAGITKIGKEIVEEGAKKGAKKAVSAIVQNMVEEGLEEFTSEMLSPLSKMPYKSAEEAWKGYKTGEIYGEAALSFVGGAIGGLIGDGVGALYMRQALGGKEGVELSNKTKELYELKEQQLEKAKAGVDYKTETEQLEKLASEYEDMLTNFAKNNPNGYRKYLSSFKDIRTAIKDARNQAKSDGKLEQFDADIASFKPAVEKYLSEHAYLTASPEAIFSQESSEALTKMLGRPVTVKYQDIKSKNGETVYGKNATRNGATTITVGKEGNYAQNLAHEASEAILTRNEATRDKMLSIMQKELGLDFNKFEKKVAENYSKDLKVVKDKDGNIDIEKTIEKNKDNKTFKKEVLSLAFEEVFDNYGKFEKLLNTAQRSRFKSLLQKIKNKFSGTKEAKLANYINKLLNSKEFKKVDTKTVEKGQKKGKKEIELGKDSEVTETHEIEYKGKKYKAEVRKETVEKKFNKIDDDGKVVKDKKGKPVKEKRETRVRFAYVYDENNNITKKVELEREQDIYKAIGNNWDHVESDINGLKSRRTKDTRELTKEYLEGHPEIKVQKPASTYKKVETVQDIWINHNKPKIHSGEFVFNLGKNGKNTSDTYTVKIEKIVETKKDSTGKEHTIKKWKATKSTGRVYEARTQKQLAIDLKWDSYTNVWAKGQVDSALKQMDKLAEKQKEATKEAQTQSKTEQKVEAKKEGGLKPSKNEHFGGKYIVELDGKRTNIEVYDKIVNKRVDAGNGKTELVKEKTGYVYLLDKNGKRYKKLKFEEKGGTYDFAEALKYDRIYEPANETIGTKEHVVLGDENVAKTEVKQQEQTKHAETKGKEEEKVSEPKVEPRAKQENKFKAKRNSKYLLSKDDYVVATEEDGMWYLRRYDSEGNLKHTNRFKDSKKYGGAWQQAENYLNNNYKTIVKQVDEKVAKGKKKAKEASNKKVAFVSRDSTATIVENATKSLKEAHSDLVFKYPGNKENFVGKAFTKLNNRSLTEKEANLMLEHLLSMEVSAKAEDGGYTVLGVLKDYLNETQTKALKKDLFNAIEEAKKADSTDSQYQKAINTVSQRLNGEIKNLKPLINTVKKIKQIKVRVSRGLKSANFDVESVNKYGIELLMKPFAKLQGTEKGYLNNQEFINDLNDVIRWYTESNLRQFEGLYYDAGLAQMLNDLYANIGALEEYKSGEKKGQKHGHSFSAENLELIGNVMATVNYVVKETRKMTFENVLPGVMQSIRSIKGSKNALTKLIKSTADIFLPAYIVNRMTLGGNTWLAELVTTKAQNAYSDAMNVRGKVADKLTEIQTRLKVEKMLGKEADFRDAKIEYDTLAYIWASLDSEANYDAINKSGLTVLIDNRTIELAEAGEAESLKDELDDLLPKEIKDYAKEVKDLFNARKEEFDIRNLYKKAFEQRYGKYNGLTFLDNYLPLLRDIGVINDKTNGLTPVDSVFKNFHDRNSSIKTVKAVGLTGLISNYIDQLATELYMHPIYKQYVMSMNTKLDSGRTVKQDLESKGLVKELKYLQDTMEMMMGKKDTKSGFISKLSARFAMSKLALNFGIWLKQYTSVFTSNIKLSTSSRALLRSFEKNTSFKSLYDEIVNEVGQVNYREKNKVASLGQLNLDNGFADIISRNVEKIGMWGTIKVDKKAIVVGTMSLMEFASKENNLSFDKESDRAKIKEFVKDHISEFIMSQIGTNFNSRNKITRGDYGDAIRGVFGFMQGAFNAALGSFVNKASLYQRNKNANKQQILFAYESAKAKLNEAEENVSKMNKQLEDAYKKGNEDAIDNAEQTLETREKDFALAKQAFEDARLKKLDFENFEIAGGRGIPLQIAGGLAMQALIITLINALMKRLKGKKEWDDWNMKDMAIEFALAYSVDWIPGVNQIVNTVFKGYDFSNPQVTMLNDIADMFTELKDVFSGSSDIGKAVTKIANAIAAFTGIPSQTIIDYLIGTTKMFSPEVGIKIKNFFYSTSLSSASRSMNDFIKRGKDKSGQTMLGYIMDQYKVDGTSDSLKKEIYALLKEGYDVMPSTIPTSYKDSNGTDVVMSSTQVKEFKQLYSAVSRQAEKLINNASYKTATSEEKAKALKKLYDAYYQYAKCKVCNGYNTATKLGRLLYLTNGNINMAEYVLYLQKIGSIVESKTKTRKELVFNYVNRLALSRRQKLLLLHLAGYTNKGTDRNNLISYIRTFGISYKDAVKYVDGDKE